jgi:cytochrome c556
MTVPAGRPPVAREMTRLCWVLTVLFAAATAVLVYLFVIRGQTVPASDGRTAILLAPGERDLVLGEMRDFLVALQEITRGVVDQDATAVATAARRVGAAAQHAVPASLVGKLPIEFKRLGFDTHGRFDQLALDTEQMGDTANVLAGLAMLMQNCTACHAAYRIDLERP